MLAIHVVTRRDLLTAFSLSEFLHPHYSSLLLARFAHPLGYPSGVIVISSLKIYLYPLSHYQSFPGMYNIQPAGAAQEPFNQINQSLINARPTIIASRGKILCARIIKSALLPKIQRHRVPCCGFARLTVPLLHAPLFPSELIYLPFVPACTNHTVFHQTQ